MSGGTSAQRVETRAATLPVWVLARQYTQEAVQKLAKLMRTAESQTVQLEATKALLDRGWGKAPIVVAGDDERPIVVDMRTIEPARLDALEAMLRATLGEQIHKAALGQAPALELEAKASASASGDGAGDKGAG